MPPKLMIPGTNEPYADFVFDPDPLNDTLPYKRASGELRVPSLVKKYTARDLDAQREISGGTGEHAGHLIATRFGAPGDKRNLSLQNPNMNTWAQGEARKAVGQGGSWYKLENYWAQLLETGLTEGKRIRIKVRVEDVYKANDRRPFMRRVEWWMKQGDGDWVPQNNNVVYGNFSSNQGRAAAAKKRT